MLTVLLVVFLRFFCVISVGVGGASVASVSLGVAFVLVIIGSNRDLMTFHDEPAVLDGPACSLCGGGVSLRDPGVPLVLSQELESVSDAVVS